MSEKIDQFCEDLRNQLNGLEAKLNAVRERVGSARAETEQAVGRKLDEAKTAIATRKSELETRKGEIEAAVAEKKAETEASIAEWKTNREVHKLEKRADRAESYAAWAILVAADALDEADIATLEAFAARLDADGAAAAATA